MPYKDYAFVQPPGIIVVGLPGALIGSLTSQAGGLAVARLLSVLASTACVPLAGRLVRHRGALVCAVTAGLLAVYPAEDHGFVRPDSWTDEYTRILKLFDTTIGVAR